MKPAPTLLDDIHRATFKPGSIDCVNRLDLLQQDLRDARRFVLDKPMSELLTDLSWASFHRTDGQLKSTRTIHRLVDQVRLAARLPHALTWIEYDYAAAYDYAIARGFFPHNELGRARTARQGWLLNQMPGHETCFRMHVFEYHDYHHLASAPFAFAWVADDDPAPTGWATPKELKQRGARTSFSEHLAGVAGYHNDRCCIVVPAYLSNHEPQTEKQKEIYLDQLRLHAAILRRVWALLATINDLPVLAKHAVVSKGFVARGAYHRFFEHKVITLHVPEKFDLRKVARQAVAIVRRRAHPVRGHWRKDFWHPGECIWVHEHIRGDKSLGFVVHDYVVEANAD